MKKWKKTLAGILAAVMILSLIPLFSLSPAAVDQPGDWMTYRAPNDTGFDESGNPTPYTPAPGYRYDETGFHTIGADYTDCFPFFTIQTKEKQNIQNGIYMDLRIDDYAYGGQEGQLDHWIAFSIWDTQNVSVGGTDHGSGWDCLLRTPGQGGQGIFQNFLTTAADADDWGSFVYQGDIPISVPIDADGKEHYVLEIEYIDGSYIIKVNGVEAMYPDKYNEHLNKLSPNGEFYIGVSFWTGEPNSKVNCSIVKFGTSKDTAQVPSGSDTKQPEENPNKPGDPVDPSTVPANTPALQLDANRTSWDGDLFEENMQMTPMDDGSFHVAMQGMGSGNFIWNIRKKLTYMAEDFPVMALVLRSFKGKEGIIGCYAGENNASYDFMWSVRDKDVVTLGENDEYLLIPVDLTDLLQGRIHTVRFDFADPVPDAYGNPDNEFDIVYAGFFRSVTEAKSYTEFSINGEHMFSEWETATKPTCVEEGVEKRVCSFCGEEETRSVPALGHVFSEWAVIDQPTAGKEGLKKRVCLVCREEETEILPKLSAPESGTDETAVNTSGTDTETTAPESGTGATPGINLEALAALGCNGTVCLSAMPLLCAAALVLYKKKRE